MATKSTLPLAVLGFHFLFDPAVAATCRGVEGTTGLDEWCQTNCNASTPYCPPSLCICEEEPTNPTPTTPPPSPTVPPTNPPTTTLPQPPPVIPPPTGNPALDRPFGTWVYIIDNWQTTTTLPADIPAFATSVSLSFVCPLAVQNGWTPEVEAQWWDLNYPGNMKFGRLRSDLVGNPGRWSGRFKELIQDAHDRSLYPILSVGGVTWGEEWKEALSMGAADLGRKLADIALAYNVGIEIDYEDNWELNNPVVQQQVLDMAAAFRERAGSDAVFTVDVGAASGEPGRYLNNLFELARSSGAFTWYNAMVDFDGGSQSFDRYEQYWRTFLGNGQELVVPSLYARSGSNRACQQNTTNVDAAAQFVLDNDFKGMYFWEVGLSSPTNCPGLEATKPLFDGTTLPPTVPTPAPPTRPPTNPPPPTTAPPTTPPAPTPPPPSGGDCEMTLFQNTDLFGDDLGGVDAIDEIACCLACQGNPSCEAFTFVPASVGWRQCYFKGNNTNVRVQSGMVSGKK